MKKKFNFFRPQAIFEMVSNGCETPLNIFWLINEFLQYAAVYSQNLDATFKDQEAFESIWMIF